MNLKRFPPTNMKLYNKLSRRIKATKETTFLSKLTQICYWKNDIKE
jgi:hypothetical protein